MWKYIQVLLFGLVLFGLSYFYTSSQNIPNVLNKAVADTSIILIGCSMLLSAVCYFWNFLDSKIVYRKYLGLIGFAFAVVHIWLSFAAFLKLFNPETWQKGTYWAPLTGLLATIIFTIMAMISNQFAATLLGGKIWRYVLRTGYIALALILGHVVFLKFARWVTWYNGGMKTLPAMSILVSLFIVVVLVMRILLWLSTRQSNEKIVKINTSSKKRKR